MPVLPPDFKRTSFAEATTITSTSPTSSILDGSFEYKADLKRDWCIGLVPHGGYLAALLTKAVKQHFQIHHANLNQPDLITFHVEFLNRSLIGPATISLQPLKLGRQFSVIRAQLLQPSSTSNLTPLARKVCMEALITQGNLTKEAENGGILLPTIPILPKENIPKRETCEPWPIAPEWVPSRPAAFKTLTLIPADNSPSLASRPKLGPSIHEQWVKWAPSSGSVFDLAALPFLADAFRPLPEAYGEIMRGNWYPTLSYGMDVRRKWGGNKEGWEWLFLRVRMRECWGGRFGLDVWILDEEGDVVATCTHTALIVGSERNLKGRVETKI